MNTITADEFIAFLQNGVGKFENTKIVGNVDFCELTVDGLHLDHVVFCGDVEGHVTVGEISIRSLYCAYYSNIGPLCYTGRMIKDMAV